METSILKKAIASSFIDIPVSGFVVNIILAGTLSIILGCFYTKYGRSLSNRKVFSYNFILITMTTMFIITVVKSSLALSLGLVGALSVIRFRSAIKEPEELAYLFLAISIGLGLGANQRHITIVAFLIILLFLFSLSKFRSNADSSANMYLSITFFNPVSGIMNQVIKVLDQNCKEIQVNRIDETDKKLELSYTVQFSDIENLENVKKEIRCLCSNAEFSVLNPNSLS